MSKVFIPASKVTSAVFFTEGDSVQQRISHIGRITLERKIKLASLLSESVIIPVSHIIESQSTFNVIRSAPSLLTKQIIIPSLPSQFSTVSEYVKARFSSFARTSLEQHRLFTVSEFLDENASKLIWRNDQEMRSFYKQSLLRDLRDPTSLLSRSLGLSSSELEALIENISSIEPMSRESSFELANKLDLEKRTTFILYLQTLYCITGSLGNNSPPLLNPRLVPFLHDRVARIPQEHDPNLFSEILESIGIAQAVLDRIPLQEIPGLSRENEVRRFRNKYHALIDKARKGLTKVVGDEFAPQALQDILVDLVGKELKKERRILKAKNIWAFSSFATALISSGVALVTGSHLASATSVISGTVSLLDTIFDLADPIISRVFDTKTEFITFSATLRRRAGLE